MIEIVFNKALFNKYFLNYYTLKKDSKLKVGLIDCRHYFVTKSYSKSLVKITIIL